MRLRRQNPGIVSTGVLASVLILGGCQGVLDDGPGGDGDDSGNPNSPVGDGDVVGDGDTTGSGGTVGVGDGDGDIYENPEVCVQGIPTTSQVPRLLNREYDNVSRDLLGVTALASAGGAAPSSLLNPDFDGAMNTFSWTAYLDAAETIAAEVMAGTQRAEFIECDPADPTCLETTIRTFGRKAFRRPITDEEVASFMRLNAITPAGTPDEVAEAILFAFLASPSFLMRTEMNPETEGDALRLSQHEVASRLSFLLWGSTPDDILSLAADNGELATGEQILTQAERMLLDRVKTGPLVAAAHRAYLGMDGTVPHWWNRTHDTAIYPEYTDDAIPAMQAELDAFFEEVAFGGGSFEDLFLSNVGFVNNLTAPMYDLDAADYGPELARVEFQPPEQRPGFLTRLGFLSSFSRYDTTSPILRGAFVTVRLVGVDPGPPAPGVENTPRPVGTFSTEREVVDELTAPDACANCHQNVINPPGYVLEWYDSVGSWQTVDPLGGPINGTADVVFGSEAAVTISSPLELMTQITQGDLARRMYAERLVAFALRRSPNSNDACLVDQLATELTVDGYTVLSLLADLTQADSFRLRKASN